MQPSKQTKCCLRMGSRRGPCTHPSPLREPNSVYNPIFVSNVQRETNVEFGTKGLPAARWRLCRVVLQNYQRKWPRLTAGSILSLGDLSNGKDLPGGAGVLHHLGLQDTFSSLQF
jgi:hypothetical protein